MSVEHKSASFLRFLNKTDRKNVKLKNIIRCFISTKYTYVTSLSPEKCKNNCKKDDEIFASYKINI